MNKLLCVFFVATFCLAGVCPFTVSAQENTETVYLTTVMYHSVVKDATGIYKISPQNLENDLSAFLKNGYTFVSVDDLINFANGKDTLPAKPLLITFDDGHYNNLYYAYPILKKYDAPAVINVIGKFSEYATNCNEKPSPNYSYLTWDDVKTLSSLGMEIGNHTYNMHDFKPRFGIKQKDGESLSDYNASLKIDYSRLNDKLVSVCDKPVRVFAYPFGLYNKTSEGILKDMGYSVTLTCNEKLSCVRKNHPEDLFLLGRYNRDGRLSTRQFINRIS